MLGLSRCVTGAERFQKLMLGLTIWCLVHESKFGKRRYEWRTGKGTAYTCIKRPNVKGRGRSRSLLGSEGGVGFGGSSGE